MMFPKSLIFILLFLPIILFSQNNSWCGFDTWLDSQLVQNPEFLEDVSKKIEENRADFIQSRDDLLIIPVVFHVIHDGGPSNISMEQIQSGIDIMNEDFRALNSDSSLIRNTENAPYRKVFADVNVEFRLAKIDPNGNCTNGVQRRFAPHLTNQAGEDCKYDDNGGLSAWPNDKYLNIWTVNSIGSSSGQGITLGYAFLPYNNWGSGHGILNRHDRVGNIGTAAQFGGRTLTHEMGHICGLLHTFQGGCHTADCLTTGDFVCDTPPVEQEFGCNQNLSTCSDVPINDYYGFDVLDQNENHMSYNTCRLMFSNGQSDLMRANFNSISNFISLTSEDNLEATGVLLPDEICKADFYTRDTVLCAGQSIQFIDNSFHAPTSWSWNFEGGQPNQSSDQNPLVTYTEPGIYSVELTVSDGQNAATISKESHIVVLPSGQTLPYFESFEEYSSLLDSDWQGIQPANTIGFEITDLVGLTGNKSLFLNNFSLPSGRLTEVTSELIDLSSIQQSMTLSFRYAYKKKATSNNERLQVLVSNDCGETWSARRTISGNSLGSQLSAISWSPLSEDDWVTVHMSNITNAFWVENFRFKFSFLSDNGNNIFIDDINIYQGQPSDDIVLSTIESSNKDLINFSLYPNPMNEEAVLSFELNENRDFDISIVDMNGRICSNSFVKANKGKNNVIISRNNLNSGIYFVSLRDKSNNDVKYLKLVLN